MTEPQNSPQITPQMTPLPTIALVSRVVTRAIDRITGDRSDYPLLVAMACKQALQQLGIESRIIYGQAAWLEVLEDNSVIWSGCWGEHSTFWVATQFGEVVDLNVSVSFRKIAHQGPSKIGDESKVLKPTHSPPLLWSREVPRFYKYIPEGVAEIELTDPRDIEWYRVVTNEISEKCTLEKLESEIKSPEFPNEPVLCPNRRLLDDSKQSFQHYDRFLSVMGIPAGPLDS